MIGAARAASQRQLILLADQRIGTTAGSQSYTIPAGSQYIDIELYGGGGGGAAGRQFTSSRQTYLSSGGGGGGGAYVRHGYTGVFGGDLLNFEIGAAGTGATFEQQIGGGVRNGASGGNTSLTSLVRGGSTVVSFSGIIAYGGFGGSNTSSTTVGGAGGTGGVAAGGNITNRNGNNGVAGQVGNLVTEVNGGRGGSGGQNDSNLSPGENNGGTGGFGNTFDGINATRAIVGGNGIVFLVGGGGGGGGGYPGDDGVGNAACKGATGGFGGIRIRSYG